jgi:dTDP-4-dehydrorhamnose reductase
MKAIVTGARGTLGRVLSRVLEARGAQVVPWDRTRLPVSDADRATDFVKAEAPDAVFHLAIASQPSSRPSEGEATVSAQPQEGESVRVNHDWPRMLAAICNAHGARFVFTSSALVFSNEARGPFWPTSEPDALAGYGGEKRMAERAVLAAHPGAVVARLGWQLASDAGASGAPPTANTMNDHVARLLRDHGEVRASTRWVPACSFLDVTAATLIALAGGPPGLFHVEQNEGWSFFDLARVLAEAQGGGRVVATDDFVLDQRLLGGPALPPLRGRLPGLAHSA